MNFINTADSFYKIYHKLHKFNKKGNALFLVLFCVIVIALFFSIYKVWILNKQFSKYCEKIAVETPVFKNNDENSILLSNIDKKLKKLSENFIQNGNAWLSLSLQEINAIIYTNEHFNYLRGHFWLRRIENGSFLADCMFEFKGFPRIRKKRYINGFCWLSLDLSTLVPKIRIQSITQSKTQKQIPPVFLNGINNYFDFSDILYKLKINEYLNSLKFIKLKKNSIEIYLKKT